jgi:fatty acid desaturase
MLPGYSIPAKINCTIIVACSALYFFLLHSAANTDSFGWKLLLGLAFGVIMIPVYSLIHEAEHGNLYPNRWWNAFLGRWLCCLFIAPFTFFRHCHLKHHKKNRTDEEIWDLYYEHQDKWLRYGNLYLMMIGVGYFALWLSVLVFAFIPGFVNHPVLRRHAETNGFLEGCDDKHKLSTTRKESVVVILFQVFVLWTINWDLASWAILLMVHGFIWSSQNYVNHAFSPRDVINGAHNLKIPVWLNYVYLNFNIHLAHHQNPQIPWLHLPGFIRSGKGRISFFKNYLRLWKGPRITHESSPKTPKS